MDGKITEQVVELNRKMMNSIAEMQKINERAMRGLAEQQVNAAESFVSVSSKQIKGMGNLTSVQDVVAAQSSIVTELGKMMVGNAKQTMDLLSRSQEELQALIKQNLGDMVEQAKAISK
ncbi:MAG: phasin family protein [Magnetococcus sp. YQC-3]